ncbi:MAG: SIMPL domain-containing protein [Patescibacteria group bacterium]
MNNTIKNYFGIALILGILAFGFSIWSIAGSVGKSINPSSLRSFSVSAEGKSTGVPDVAEFTFSVITEGGEKLAELQTENTEKMNKAIAFLKEQGVKKEDIKTSQYSVNPRYESYSCGRPIYSGVGGPSVEPCPPPKIVGYVITQSASVKIRDFGKAGDIVSGVVKSGVNETSNLNFTIDDPTSVTDAARAEAIEKAQKKAESIAKAGGFRVGKLISIYESGGGYPIYYGKAAALGIGGDGAEGASAPSIEPGSEDVIVNVTLTYEIR